MVSPSNRIAMKIVAFSIFLSLFQIGSDLLAQGMAAQNPPCSDPNYRQFDFWIGEWDVFVGENFAGTNKVERILDGCVLMENWVGSKGGKGHSFNVFDNTSGKWEQTWVDNQGGVIHFYGTFADGKMALEGNTVGQNGEPARSKLSFWNNTDGTVRQLWELSTDDGKSWTVIFDGLYKRKG
jgi:hypothetical protein